MGKTWGHLKTHRLVGMVVLVGTGALAALPARAAARAGDTTTNTLAMRTYAIPAALANDRGYEPSIGAGFQDDSVLVTADPITSPKVLRVSWDDHSPGTPARWADASPVVSPGGDPYLWTDRLTGRTLFTTDRGAAFATDDEGKTWWPSQPVVTPAAYDHETIGGGAHASSARLGVVKYPNAIYYCASGLGESECARSDDGGTTWLPPRVVAVGDCNGFPGPPVVGPSGLVVLAYHGCTTDGHSWMRGMMVSDDGGTTWHQRLIPSLTPGPYESIGDLTHVAIDGGGRLYAITGSGGHTVVVTSADEARHWSQPGELGASFGIRNMEFPMATAGDAGRAAVAFYGSTTGGNDRAASFAGVWHLYIAETIDAGKSWTTVDATPDKPIHRGRICLGVGACTRYLGDFQSMTYDAHGRVLVSYSDGCMSAACRSSSGTPADSTGSYLTIARQTAGPRLIAADDPPGAAAPGQPLSSPPAASSSGCTTHASAPPSSPCIPTPAQCAAGSAPPATVGTTPGMLAICVATGGHIVAYVGGNPPAGCGDIIADDRSLAATVDDPNGCA